MTPRDRRRGLLTALGPLLLPGLVPLLAACASASPEMEDPPSARVPRAPANMDTLAHRRDTVPADTAPAEGAPAVPLVAPYPSFDSVRPPLAYRQAVGRGTRGERGLPGRRYWQQEVHYRIEAELDTAAARLSGRERIRYVNDSPDSLRTLFVHLYQNVFREGVRRNREVEPTGGIRLELVNALGDTLRELTLEELRRGAREGRPPVGYAVQGTLARLFLPAPVAPGDTASLGFEWSFRVPEEAFRMGRVERSLFAVAQWYPQVATYDDVEGHDVTPYLGDGEFYLEYGSFDVSLTLPEGWLATATGTLRNPRDVLRPEAEERLERAAASDTVVAVVDSAARADGLATRTSATGRLTWRFVTEQPVRDFAFAASSRYVWDAVGAEVGGDVGRTRVDALYDPKVSHWREAARYSRHALEYFSDFILPYPYPHASAALTHVGGMEYPMVVFIGRSEPGEPLYSVLAHEFSHEWFPMIVGSKEAHHAWMDEGLTTFNEALAREDFFEDSRARERDMSVYMRAAREGVEAPVVRHTDYVESGLGRVVAAYMKPAVLLHALRDVMGEASFDRAYRRYAVAWKWKHPYPWDFFRIMEEEAGRELDWFWRAWFYETGTLDQAVSGVVQEGDGVRVTVENRGRAVMPVHLRITYGNGETRDVRWPAEVWGGTRRVSRTLPAERDVDRVALDPEHSFPDLNRANNAWTR